MTNETPYWMDEACNALVYDDSRQRMRECQCPGLEAGYLRGLEAALAAYERVGGEGIGPALRALIEVGPHFEDARGHLPMTCEHCGHPLFEGRCFVVACLHERIAAVETELNGAYAIGNEAATENAALRAEVAQLKFERNSRHGEAGTWERQYHEARAEVEKHVSELVDLRNEWAEARAEVERLTWALDHLVEIGDDSGRVAGATILRVARAALQPPASKPEASREERLRAAGFEDTRPFSELQAALGTPVGNGLSMGPDVRGHVVSKDFVDTLENAGASKELVSALRKDIASAEEAPVAVSARPHCSQCYDKVTLCVSCASRKPTTEPVAVCKYCCWWKSEATGKLCVKCGRKFKPTTEGGEG